MNATDLMIGDWVRLIDSQCTFRMQDVSGTSYFKRWTEDGEIMIPYSYNEIEPIPLTTEILEKNGFITEERECDPTFPYLAFIIENDEYRIETTWYDSHDVYEPNTGEYLHGAAEVWNMEILSKGCTYDCGKNKLFVHELQHAMKLCGIDKTIEL